MLFWEDGRELWSQICTISCLFKGGQQNNINSEAPQVLRTSWDPAHGTQEEDRRQREALLGSNTLWKKKLLCSIAKMQTQCSLCYSGWMVTVGRRDEISAVSWSTNQWTGWWSPQHRPGTLPLGSFWPTSVTCIWDMNDSFLQVWRRCLFSRGSLRQVQKLLTVPKSDNSGLGWTLLPFSGSIECQYAAGRWPS